jgi:hypothetical protein
MFFTSSFENWIPAFAGMTAKIKQSWDVNIYLHALADGYLLIDKLHELFIIDVGVIRD